jgi:hypothetical protein
VAVSLGTIAIAAGAYVLILVLALSLLSSAKRGDRELRRAAGRARAQRARAREGQRRDVA